MASSIDASDDTGKSQPVVDSKMTWLIKDGDGNLLVAAVHRGRKHQLSGRRRLRPLAAGGMGVWWGHPRPVGGKSGLLPVLALTAAKDRKMISPCHNRTASQRTTSWVD